MRNEELKQSTAQKKNTDRAPYESPAIIYEGLITTRAATPDSSRDAKPDGADAADIFSTDG